MNELNEKAINMCQAMIGFKPGVSDGDIDTAISTVTSLPMFAGLNKIELKKSLLSIYNVKVDTYQILEGRDARIPWLKEFKAECRSEWLFWTRYKKYLAEQKHFAPEVIFQLDDLTDRILDKLFNPQRSDVIINKNSQLYGADLQGRRCRIQPDHHSGRHTQQFKKSDTDPHRRRFSGIRHAKYQSLQHEPTQTYRSRSDSRF